jgi:hypothetical protein
MALTSLALPSQITTFPCPIDAALTLCNAQTLTATGYLGNASPTQIDLGGNQPVAGVGRTDFIWTMQITSINFGSADESYTFRLLGSNDVAWGSGNIELLAMHDFAATSALRSMAGSVLGATPTIPPPGRGGSLIQLPASNQMQMINYRYVRAHLTLVGTAGSGVTLTSWLSRANINV